MVAMMMIITRMRQQNVITTIAGSGSQGTSGDGEAATSAQLGYPSGVSADISGNVYIADQGNHNIRMVSSTGFITTIAGTGTTGSCGDGGAATSAQLGYPSGLSVDISGKVYIADQGNHNIRMFVPLRRVTSVPTGQPTRQPSARPTITNSPQRISSPTGQPSHSPSRQPTRQPTSHPTISNSPQRISLPTASPPPTQVNCLSLIFLNP